MALRVARTNDPQLRKVAPQIAPVRRGQLFSLKQRMSAYEEIGNEVGTKPSLTAINVEDVPCTKSRR